jgi:hypothetical protein
MGSGHLVYAFYSQTQIPKIFYKLMKRLLLMVFVYTASYAKAQLNSIPEDISFGFYGRAETNFYRYYANEQLGDFFTDRVNNAYSAGLSLHSSLTHLFNANISMGFGEVNYRPDIRTGNSTLYQASLRLWTLNAVGELKFNDKPRSNMGVWFGFQGIFKESGSEIFSGAVIQERQWPQTRYMPQFGISFQYKPRKIPIHFKMEAGMRLNSTNRTGYDYGLSQVFGGLHMLYRVKSW